MNLLLNERKCQWLSTITDNTELDALDLAEIFTLIKNLKLKKQTNPKYTGKSKAYLK